MSVRLAVQDADFQLYVGDALETLRTLPDGSVDCCVTSPPYHGLRDYGSEGQLGLEPTVGEYVRNMVEVFAEVRRVLADTATLWLNLGDSFGEKQLQGIPWRVAFALQADGWFLRSDIVWSKPNPMPESVTDRPTKSHEFVFLLSKQPRYFFDQEAVRERYADPERSDLHYPANGSEGVIGQQNAGLRGRGPDGRKVTAVVGKDGSEQHRNGERWPNPTGRNVRSVWEIATQPYPEAHFATYPEALVRRCILAGCPERTCAICRAPYRRVVSVTYEKSPVHGAGSVVGRHYETGANNYDGAGMPRLNKVTETLGWEPTCECNGHFETVTEIERIPGTDHRVSGPVRVYVPNSGPPPVPEPGVVLDPFGGSGTTALVARNHGRKAVLIELNADYAALAAKRLQQLSLLAEPA